MKHSPDFILIEIICPNQHIKTGAILRLNKKNVEEEKLPHQFFLTARETTKIRNTFASNVSTVIKLNKAQISLKTQPVR